MSLQAYASLADGDPWDLRALEGQRTNSPLSDRSLTRRGDDPSVACPAATGRSRTEMDWSVVARLGAAGRLRRRWQSRLPVRQADPEQTGSVSAAETGWGKRQARLSCLRTGCGQRQAAVSCSAGCSSRAWQRAPTGTQWVQQTGADTSQKRPRHWHRSGTGGSWTSAVGRPGLVASGEHAGCALMLLSSLSLSGRGSLEPHCRLRQGACQSLAGVPAANCMLTMQVPASRQCVVRQLPNVCA